MEYRAVLIDPPWEFRVYSAKGKGRSAESHYPTMTLDALKALNIAPILAPDCAVFVWVTWPVLFEAKALAEAWNLEYKTCAFNWVKLNKMQRDTAFTGMGYWTRSNSEPCLLFTKGKPKRKSKAVKQLLLEWTGGLFPETLATPIGEHSQKPEVVYQRIEQLVGGDSFCELFARQPRKGWTTLGNEIDGLDIQEAINREAERGK